MLVFSDSLIYSYPLRVVAFDALRHGSLPLWTPTLLSGYPLLSMAQLGIGYPLTWLYLLLPGYWAEQIYILAPYLLAPMFIYAYLREVSVSRAAALLAGLSFTYGGMMAGGLAHNGMFTNAVMWLPLMLIAIERARTGRFERGVLSVAGAYSMSVLTGIGQAFLYTGLIALAYAAFVTFVVSSTGDSKFEIRDLGSAWRLKVTRQKLRPLIVCVCGMTLAAGVAAFQILETLRAQQRSIRSELTYDIFSGGGFTAWQTFKAFFAPYHNLNWEATPYVAVLTGVLALAAVVAALRSPLAHRRVWFWLGLALLGWVLMLGDHTPLYRLAFHIPVVNRFRLPWRHTFEWSFAVSVLGGFGFDIVRRRYGTGSGSDLVLPKPAPHELPGRYHSMFRTGARAELIGLMLFAGLIAVGIGWWRASGLRLAAGEALLSAGESTQFITMSQRGWIGWELGFTLLALLTLGWCWRMNASRWRDGRLRGRLRGWMPIATVSMACCLEGFMMVSVWWFPYAKPAGYFQTISAPAQFLKQYPPEQNRIYTSLADYSLLNVALAEPHNLSALHGFHNAAGYEPLMPDKYRQAFDGRWSFFTPWFGAPGDPQMLSPRWQVLDILNTRFLVEYSATVTKTIEKDGVAFAARDMAMTLEPKASVTLTGAAAADSLSLVSALANAGELAQGETFAHIAVQTFDGRTIERGLKAGVDSAEWAHERADVKAVIKHRLAPIFDAVPGDGQNSFQANRYWSRIELGEKVAVDRVQITNVAQHASLILTKATLYDSSKRLQQAMPLTQRLPDHWQKRYDQEGVQIYENQHALPRVWLATQAESVTSDEALRRIRGQSEAAFNPKTTALLEAPPETLRGLSGGELGPDDKAQIVRYESNRLAIETNAAQQTVLVVSEMSYPGWEAKVDGQPANLWTTDYLLRGVILPAGKHRVEMRYTAPAARNGAILSALSLLALIGLALKSRRRQVQQ